MSKAVPLSKRMLGGLPDDFLLELGRMTALWTQLEGWVNHLLSILASRRGAEAPTMVLVAHSSFRQRRECIGALCEVREEEGFSMPSSAKICSALEGVERRRNQFAHNSCLSDPKTGQIMMIRFSARNKVKYGIIPVSVEELSTVNESIWETQRLLTIYMAAVSEALKIKPSHAPQ